jgi:NhaP-type Na+/H+ or K+/H+ antiporter
MTKADFVVELIGIVGFVTNVWANLLIARKSERGWTVRLVCNAIWLTYSIFAFSIANGLNSIAFAAINVYGLRKWRRERRALDELTKQNRCHGCGRYVKPEAET